MDAKAKPTGMYSRRLQK